MSRAMKIVREAERDLEAGELPPKRRRVDSPTADAVKAEDVPQGQATPQPPLLPQSQLDSLATLHKPSLLATAGSPLPPSSSVAHPPSAFDTGSPNPGGFQLGSGREAPSPSAAARARVMSLFGESTDVNIASSSSSLSFSKDLAPVVGHSEKVRPPLAIALETQLASPLPKSSLPRRNFIDSAPRPTTSAREPLRNTTNTFAGVGFATPQPKKLSKRINIQTPGTTPRRIGLGSTSNARKARTGFSTPFKTGARPTSALNPAASPRPAAAVASLKPKREPVFDLNRELPS